MWSEDSTLLNFQTYNEAVSCLVSKLDSTESKIPSKDVQMFSSEELEFEIDAAEVSIVVKGHWGNMNITS